MQWNMNRQTAVNVIRGGFAAILVILLMTGCTALCIEKGYLDISKIQFITPVIWLFASFAGTYITGEKGTTVTILPSIITVAIVFVLITMCGIFSQDGISGRLVITSMISNVLGGGIGIFFKSRNPKKGRARKHKRSFR